MTTRKYPLADPLLAKDVLMVIGITRESVDTGDLRRLLVKLEALASSREETIAWKGKPTFYFEWAGRGSARDR